MTTFIQGKLSKSFTIRYLLVDVDTSYFAFIDKKTLKEIGGRVSTPHLTMKFPTLIEEIVTVKADQKQAQQCYVESLKVTPYPPIGEPIMPLSRMAKGTQVITVGKRPQILALTIHQFSLDYEFDIDSRDKTSDRGLKPIEELVQLQLEPKPG